LAALWLIVSAFMLKNAPVDPSPSSQPSGAAKEAGVAARLTHWLHWLTIEQWRTIDREYGASGQFSGRSAGVLVILALALLIQRYWGAPDRCAAYLVALGIDDDPQRPGLIQWIFWAAFKSLGYFLPAWLYIRLVLRERLRDFGVRLDRDARILWLYGFLIVGAIVVAGVAAQSPAFVATYPKYKGAGDDWFNLLAWFAAYGVQFASLEFLFRGFLLFGLVRHLGALAIFVMIVPYSMIHYAKPWLETIGSMIGGVALGTLALRTRSIFGGVIAHTMVAWAMDLFALAAQGRLLRLISSFFA
jgi:membrane protease YdiL (CAAX protease family)